MCDVNLVHKHIITHFHEMELTLVSWVNVLCLTSICAKICFKQKITRRLDESPACERDLGVWTACKLFYLKIWSDRKNTDKISYLRGFKVQILKDVQSSSYNNFTHSLCLCGETVWFLTAALWIVTGWVSVWLITDKIINAHGIQKIDA